MFNPGVKCTFRPIPIGGTQNDNIYNPLQKNADYRRTQSNMAFSLILFLLVIVMGLCLACWLALRVSETSVLPNSKTLQEEAGHLKRYQVLCRLFDQDVCTGRFVGHSSEVRRGK